MTSKLVRHFDRNTRGRDFAVGDVHGMYSMLEDLLDQVGFDPACDRLFCVGDLIDRGPESDRTLEFLAYEWFHAVQGNHERMLIESIDDPDGMHNWTTNNGGEWWLDIDAGTQAVFRKAIDALPIAMEVETEEGLVGIVHADIPAETSWHDFLDLMEDDKYLQYYAVWSRNRLRRAEARGEVPRVEGLRLLLVGHTPLRQAAQMENIYYLDTAAAYWEDVDGAKLSLLQFSPGLELTAMETHGSLREY
ncbi:MAG: metallophosphoesterase [Gammaproteobacteria bacterium]|nr:metallophosphoesterase [Gammaproteobacteria bacterium]MDX5375800.1 metallophosphoesterase [Gammaproteobacteria bacterium]